MTSQTPTELAGDTSDPLRGLQAVRSLRLLTESLELRQVEAALRTGLGWTEIGDALGVSRQAVHKKYARRIDPSIDTPRRKRS